MNIKVLEKVVNKKYSLPKLLKQLYPENSYEYGRPCFCPFHDNTNTPAAVIYDDVEGDNLWCYSEHKMYRATDVLNKLYKKDIYEIGQQQYEAMDDFEKMSFNTEIDYNKEFASEVLEKEDREVTFAKQRYKDSEISLSEYLGKTISSG